MAGNLTGNVTAASGTSTFTNVTVNGTLDVTGTTIANVTDPVNAQDAATKNYVDTTVAAVIDAAPAALDTLNELAAALGDDANFATTITNSIATKLPLAGGTMSGAIAMGTSKITGMGDPVANQDAATKKYSDDQDALKLNLTGGTLTGTLALGANKITTTYTPTDDPDLTTKVYVDAILGSGIAAATSAANASTSETNAATSETNASNSASAASASETNAAASENTATNEAATATTQAGVAASEAATATTQAGIATTQAGAASTSASNASASEIAAAASESAASTSETNAATSAANAATSETNAATSEGNAATSATNAAASYDAFDDRYLGAKASAPTLDNDGNALLTGAIYWNTSTNNLHAWAGSLWEATTPTPANQVSINIVAGELVYSEDLGSITAAVTTGTGNSITLVGDSIADVTTVAGSIANVNLVAGSISNVNSVASNATNINSAVGNQTNINSVAGNEANINLTAGSITNVNLVGGSVANVNTVAASIADINRYAAEYLISATAPSSPTAGDLWYDSVANTLKYYTGSIFASISAGIASVAGDTSPQLGGELDAQNNNMTNVGTISGSNLQLDFGGL